MKQTKDQLLALIDQLRTAIAGDDSFEGNVIYTAMADGLERHEFEVSAAFRIGNSEGQGGMIVIQGQPEPAPDLEMPRMLVLSTAHITYETSQALAYGTGTLPRGIASRDHGWLIPIYDAWPGYQAEDEDDPIPADLIAIRDLAVANGCTWICLDSDGDTIEGLPSYSW